MTVVGVLLVAATPGLVVPLQRAIGAVTPPMADVVVAGAMPQATGVVTPHLADVIVSLPLRRAVIG
jgi:hypothetical protein